MRKLATELEGLLGQEVMVEGWVNSRRDHGGLIFIDLRDHTGIIQLVVTPETVESFKLAESVRDEFVLQARGKMREREPELINPNIPTGKIELVVDDLTLLNKSATPPVNTHDDGEKSSEELRLKYRYLDLRRPAMQKLLKRRSDYYRFIRNYMYERDFTEVSTPILANSSPEGARDFLVPSRLHPGKFYALPQAPQQFKQLLMVGGVDKYFQIAPCFRDEDPRADRLYGDFYQLDMEMSFVEDGEMVRQEIEPLFVKLA
ncbi:aspartate--tRNA ligase, partial [Candidatus Saccharibacteria bacterium]|nr:aspartate--tRNA ligase [Candidatus Saccharibacteria bacterium]